MASAFVSDVRALLDGVKVTLPPGIPANAFWSSTLYDDQTRSMLKTPQKHLRAGSQNFPSERRPSKIRTAPKRSISRARAASERFVRQGLEASASSPPSGPTAL